MVKGNRSYEKLDEMRRTIMLSLFDVGRLIIDDEKKLRAFHNEIADLTRFAHKRVCENMKSINSKEKQEVIDAFGVTGHKNENSGLKAELHELLLFMYSDEDKHTSKIHGFLSRAQGIIDTQFENNYGEIAIYNTD